MNEENLQKQITELKIQIESLQNQRKKEQQDTMHFYAELLKSTQSGCENLIPGDDILSALVEDKNYEKEKSNVELQLKKQVSELIKSVDFSIDSI